jgi:hypothetical protein
MALRRDLITCRISRPTDRRLSSSAGWKATKGGCFAIGSVASGSPSLEEWKGFAPNDVEYWDFQRWLDDDHIATKFEGQSLTCPSGNCEAVLERVGRDWSFQRKP